MAESKGALIAKTVQKHAGRAKEKVFTVLLLSRVFSQSDGVFMENVAWKLVINRFRLIPVRRVSLEAVPTGLHAFAIHLLNEYSRSKSLVWPHNFCLPLGAGYQLISATFHQGVYLAAYQLQGLSWPIYSTISYAYTISTYSVYLSSYFSLTYFTFGSS